jgi:hypothetical protein
MKRGEEEGALLLPKCGHVASRNAAIQNLDSEEGWSWSEGPFDRDRKEEEMRKLGSEGGTKDKGTYKT